MLSHKIIRKIGRSQIPVLALFWMVAAHADEVGFSATVDRTSMTLNDTVTLTLSVRTDSQSRAGEPQMKAPDFDVINQFSSISVNSTYDATQGRFTMQNNQQVAKVLRPLKLGTLKISDIQLNLGGKILTAPDIVIQVVQGKGNNQNSNPSPRDQVGTKNPGAAAFIRAEVDQDSVYKGQQVIVSYYLYHRGKVFNIQIDKFPVLSGFLREDLELPVMGQRFESEQVQVNGVPYERSLLARYAAYPLQEGKLQIDSMALRYNYYVGSRGGVFEDEDPFFGLFQQLAPRAGNSRSEQIGIQVLPLPDEGRPESFVGGVGDFTVISAVDKYEVRANEAVTLTVKVDGRGNIATIKEPKNRWPESIDLYDTKGRTQAGKGGGGSKIFEFLLIPRVPGKLHLPPIEFGFFDPVKKKYYTRSTEAIDLNVLDPAPGTSLVPVTRNQSSQSRTVQEKAAPKVEDIRYLKTPSDFAKGMTGLSNWKFLFGSCFFLLCAFLGLVGLDLLKKKKQAEPRKSSEGIRLDSNTWDRLRFTAKEATNGAAWQEISQAYERLTDELLNGLDSYSQLGVRSFSRFELRKALVEERGMAPPLWERIVKVLEYADLVRFASAAGGASESAARNELSHWVKEGESLLRELSVRTGDSR